MRKNKKSEIWTKKALSEYFGLKFQKANVMFEINALEFIQIPKIQQNNNDNRNKNNGTKIALFGYFGGTILKIYCHV